MLGTILMILSGPSTEIATNERFFSLQILDTDLHLHVPLTDEITNLAQYDRLRTIAIPKFKLNRGPRPKIKGLKSHPNLDSATYSYSVLKKSKKNKPNIT